MTAAALTVVSDTPTPREAAPESISERVKRLQLEAQGLAREHVRTLEAALAEAAKIAAEVAAGGDAYPIGVRELADRLAPDLDGQRNTIEALVTRKHH
ncbi:MAG: hypothetical protein U1E50_12165 [Caulobacteraceae bacterium]